jgi:Bacterial regulatory helix-turn-helix proteins, AraC family
MPLMPPRSGRHGSLLCRAVPHGGTGQTRRPDNRLYADWSGRAGAAFSGRLRSIIRRFADWGVQVDLNRLRNAYYRSGVLSPDQYSGLIRLLEIFAQQLSLMASEMMIRDAEAEAPMIRRARAYIAGHLADPISLHDVARALHVSPFYFCRIFKKATSLTFSAYLSRTSGTGKESPAKFSSSYQ